MQLFRVEILEKPEPRKQLFVFNYVVMAEKIEDVEQILVDDGRLGRHGEKLVHIEAAQGVVVARGLETRSRKHHKELQAMRKKHGQGVVYDG
jgi:hypothetical protein